MVSADLLKGYDFFKGFSEEETKKLADIAVEQSYKAGFQIWKKGDQAQDLYLLEEGKVVMAMDTYMGTAKPPMPVTVDVVTKGEAMGPTVTRRGFLTATTQVAAAAVTMSP